MQRRFEMYALRDDLPDSTADAFLDILRGSGRFIPQLLDSLAERNQSSTAVDLVWEHAYQSAEAYDAYMCHPYHICVLDRYLLPDAPCCITAAGPPGLGLIGYEIDTPRYRRESGLRRIVAFRVSDTAAPTEVTDLLRKLEDAASSVRGLELSIAAANSMGQEWFPGLWTHVWEQAFSDATALEEFKERAATEHWLPPELVSTTADVHYPIHAASGDAA